jgi:hypothetical protein
LTRVLVLIAAQHILETEPTGKASKDFRALWRYVEKELDK